MEMGFWRILVALERTLKLHRCFCCTEEESVMMGFGSSMRNFGAKEGYVCTTKLWIRRWNYLGCGIIFVVYETGVV